MRAPLRALCVMAALASASNARAEGGEQETPQTWNTDDSAYTLEGGRLRVGLFKVQYAPLEFVTLGTYTLPWSVLAATVHGKLRLLHIDPVTVSVQLGFAYFDSSRLQWLDDSAGSAIVTALPLEAYGAYHFGDAAALSLGVAYTEVGVDGTLSYYAFDGAAQGASDNLQLVAAAELRLSDAIGVVVVGRLLLLQRVVSHASGLLRPDPFTTVAVHGAVAASEFSTRSAFSVVPSLLLTLGAFNLRAGVGYGNFNVPLVNFVLPQRTPIPEFDLYFVF